MSKDLFSIKPRGGLPLVLATLTGAAIFFVSQFVVGIVIVIVLILAGQSREQLEVTFGADSYWPKFFVFLIISFIMVWLTFIAVRLWRKYEHKSKKSAAEHKTEKKLIETKRKIDHTQTLKFLMLNKFPNAWQFVEIIAVYGLYMMTTFTVTLILSIFSPIDVTQSQDLGIDSPETLSARWAIFLMLVVLPPIAEEVLFRGFLFNTFKKYAGIGFAAVLTSVLFGIAHLEYQSLNWIAAVDTLVFSGFLILISQKHQSLYSSMFLHAIKNALAFYLLFVIGA